MSPQLEVRAGDWREVLPGTYDPDSTVVITDPPYGLGAVGGAALRAPGTHATGARARLVGRIDKGYADDVPWAEHVRQVLELLPARRHVIRGPSTLLNRRDHPQPRRLCVEVAQFRKRTLVRPGVVPHLWQGWAVYGRLRIGRAARAQGFAYLGAELVPEYAAAANRSFETEQVSLGLEAAQ